MADALKVFLPSFILYNLAGVLARPWESRVSNKRGLHGLTNFNNNIFDENIIHFIFFTILNGF